MTAFVRSQLKRGDKVAFKTTEEGLQVTKIGTIKYVGPVKFFKKIFGLTTKSTRRHAVIHCEGKYYVKQLTSLLNPEDVVAESSDELMSEA